MNIHPSHIHLWTASLISSPSLLSQSLALLNKEERIRSDRLRQQQDQERFILARGAPRAILAEYLNLPASELKFTYTDYKKPILAETTSTSLHFNLSHSENKLLLGITLNHPIGVDLEKIQPTFSSKIAKRYFSDQLYEWLMHQPLETQAASFYQLWALKEAFVKAIGKGIFATKETFSLSDPLNLDSMQPVNNLWQLKPLSIDSRYAAAIASNQSLNSLYYFNYLPKG